MRTKQTKILLIKSAFATAIVFIFSQVASAIIYEKKESLGYIRDPLKLKASLIMPVQDKIENIQAPINVLKTRIKKSKVDERVEKLQIKVPVSTKAAALFAADLAKPGNATRLYDYLVKQMRNSEEKPFKDGTKRIDIDEKSLPFLDLRKLADLFTRPHHSVVLDTSHLKKDLKLLKIFLEQISSFFSAEERGRINQKIERGLPITLETELLPRFAKKMVRKYLVFKGPNCFHASLAFHGGEFANSKLVNVKQEKGYHRAMINYDEFWKAIVSQFYEIDVNASPLKYGDMLVFFDVPKKNSTNVYFRWIRHASTYLFGPYTFSKGSKSPDTPYTIKTLDEEWKTWSKYSSNLGVKVFRKKSERLNKIPPPELIDWVY